MRSLIAAAWLAGLAAGGVAAQEAVMSWSQATGMLQRERDAGEGCARVVKRHLPEGDLAALSRAELEYDAARIAFNGVIASLQTALADRAEGPALAEMEAGLTAGSGARQALCARAEALALPAEPGARSVAEAVAATLGELVKGASGLWEGLREDDALRRAEIGTKLEDAVWPAFADIETSA